MKKTHIVVLAATYRDYEANPEILNSLPPIEPPKNWVDETKKAGYIQKETEKRIAALGDYWTEKEFRSLHVRFFDCPDPAGPAMTVKHDIPIDGIDETTDVVGLLAPVVDSIADAQDHGDEIKFVGVGVRDILRVLCKKYGSQGGALLPFHKIADQRSVLDAVGFMESNEAGKALGVHYALRKGGVDIPNDYQPGRSAEKDCIVTMQSYNTFLREVKTPKLAL